MDWTIIGHVADALGIISFIFSTISLMLNVLIFSRLKQQKAVYTRNRKKLFEELSALRQNIWDDHIITDKTCDSLQTALSSMRQCFPMLLSPMCNYHIWRCTHLLKKDDFENNKMKIRADLNYLIARLSKKE